MFGAGGALIGVLALVAWGRWLKSLIIRTYPSA